MLSLLMVPCLYSGEYKVTFINKKECSKGIGLCDGGRFTTQRGEDCILSSGFIIIPGYGEKIITVRGDQDLYTGKTRAGNVYGIYPRWAPPQGSTCFKRIDQTILLND